MSCPAAKRCGGCSGMRKPYAQELQEKEERLRRLLSGLCPVEPIAGMADPYFYRCKVNTSFVYLKDRGLVSGPYEESTHRVVAVDRCLIESETAGNIIADLRALFTSFKIRAYDERTGYGLVRHVLIRVGRNTGEVMVVLVMAAPTLPSRNAFLKALLAKHPEITTVVLNVNDRFTSMVLGPRSSTLYGRGYIVDELCGLRFRISPSSFYQVNPVQAEKLYRKAIELCGLTGKETVIDAYCGTGTIGCIAASKAGQVLGIELNRDAVHDAICNAKENGIGNIRFLQADATQCLCEMAARRQKADVVILDPPRSGSTEAFIDAVARLAPARVVYVSCGPDTLARDLRVFRVKGYRAERAWPVDMFPFTEHVETVCLLSKLSEAKHSIDVKLDMDELDVTTAETKATYEEIKAYVLNQTGLQVSSLYIAQVKRECGIIERENYNKPKMEDAKQPQCPDEKKKAIEEALKHFGMI